MKKNKVVLFNIICSLLQQVVVTISAFILPRFILSAFGSEINGLVSSLTQFLSYVSLLEGGLTGVVSANLYEPLANSDDQLLSRVLKTASNFYRKIGIIYVIYTILIGVIYPLIVKSNFSITYIFSLTLILSINLLIQYLFSITWKTLLNADKKGFVVSLTYIVVVILNTIITIVVLHFYKNIHLVKFVSALIYLIQPIVYGIYINRHYKITKKIDEDKQLMTQRWDGFAINIAAFVHNNTDIVVLSILATLSDVSVYAIYMLVINGLKSIVMAVSSPIVPVVGNAYAKGDKEALHKAFNKHEFIVLFLSFFLFTVGGLCITPFVMIYTKGVTDVNYNQPVFGWLIILAELVYCIKDPHLSLAYSANKFKDLRFIAYLEAILNIIISVCLVPKFGIIGVAIGTLVAMSVRTIYQICYLKFNILFYSFKKLFSKFFGYFVCLLFIFLICNKIINYNVINLLEWIIVAMETSIVTFLIYFTYFVFINFTFCKDFIVKLKKK